MAVVPEKPSGTTAVFGFCKADEREVGARKTLRGDRSGDLAALAGRRWDAAIDTSGYVPGQVRRSAGRLAGTIGHYTFISTVSVYAGPSPDGTFGEEAPLRRSSADELARAETIAPVGPVIGESYGSLYGGLKALCEEATLEALGGRALIVRPGLLVGPHDPTDRFTYWPARLARGGEVLAPGEPGAPRQLPRTSLRLSRFPDC
jgi:2'-hydroxyisoflavone reductase